MKTLQHLIPLLVIISMSLSCKGSNQKVVKDTANTETWYYAIEIDGNICGFSEIDIMPASINDRNFTYVESNVKLLLSLISEVLEPVISDMVANKSVLFTRLLSIPFLVTP